MIWTVALGIVACRGMMMNNQTARSYFDTPPLRYVGSKWQLSDWIVSQFPPHDAYVEPFAGSAAVFFRKHPSELEVLNDLDGDVVNFFHVLRENPDELIRQIDLTPHARVEYELSLQPCDEPVERARRFYVSVWQSFGATIIRSSGWRRQTKTGMRSPITRTWSRLDGLYAAAARLKQAQIENLDAIQVIQDFDSPRTLFYVDPPYVMKSRSGGGRKRYRHEMDDTDHQQLADVLHRVQGMVILSGYASSLYDELFQGWTRLDKTTTTNGNSEAVESLWLSPRTVSMNVLPLFRGLE